MRKVVYSISWYCKEGFSYCGKNVRFVRAYVMNLMNTINSCSLEQPHAGKSDPIYTDSRK